MINTVDNLCEIRHIYWLMKITYDIL